ncbi:hypothetical protein [Carboxylicivirga sp. N1Y90]|uniref:hypothetical protein n=1 Tax=Carboxylicivirga fragile TaxID=3417571 RepID=UPI003D34A58D|nr:hypothetical protein [Marinilabiliaceae bacterium N1Y90]
MTQEEIIKKLEQIAKQKDVPFYSSSEVKYKIPNLARRYIAARYVIYDLRMVENGLYFIFYDSSTGGTYRSSAWGETFCGLFMAIDDFNSNVTIKKRQWIDRLSVRRRYLTGNRLLDQAITIHSDSKSINQNFLKEKKIEFLNKMMRKINPIKVETEVDSWNIVPELDHKTVISISVNRWLTSSNQIEWFVVNACKYLLEE